MAFLPPVPTPASDLSLPPSHTPSSICAVFPGSRQSSSCTWPRDHQSDSHSTSPSSENKTWQRLSSPTGPSDTSLSLYVRSLTELWWRAALYLLLLFFVTHCFYLLLLSISSGLLFYQTPHGFPFLLGKVLLLQHSEPWQTALSDSQLSHLNTAGLGRSGEGCLPSTLWSCLEQ